MTRDALLQPIERLAAIDRSSCSAGELEAAEWIATALREHGASARVERERVHGTYWWPLGLPAALGIAAAHAGRRRRRGLGASLGAAAAALVIDELGTRRRLLRRVLPKRLTANVVATSGDASAERTLIVVAHHDAAHTGIFYNPKITAFAGRWLRREPGEAPRALPLMAPIVLGPALTGIGALFGSRRLQGLGATVCAGIIASFTDIALSATVPGANDNLTGVATLLALARALEQRPLVGLKVILLSTGAEEALMDGMSAFLERHSDALAPERTAVLCVDTVGSPQLVLAEAEGMLRAHRHDRRLKDLLDACAADAGVVLRRGVTMRLGTDGYVALRRGLPTALLMSLDDAGMASNYHWRTDTPERVDASTLRDAVRLCELFVRRLAAEAT